MIILNFGCNEYIFDFLMCFFLYVCETCFIVEKILEFLILCVVSEKVSDSQL